MDADQQDRQAAEPENDQSQVAGLLENPGVSLPALRAGNKKA
jgi:hypothetical protein